MLPYFPTLPHDFGLEGNYFGRLEVPAGVKFHLLSGLKKEEKLLVEALGFLLIGSQDDKRPRGPASDLREQVSRGRPFQAVDGE